MQDSNASRNLFKAGRFMRRSLKFLVPCLVVLLLVIALHPVRPPSQLALPRFRRPRRRRLSVPMR